MKVVKKPLVLNAWKTFETQAGKGDDIAYDSDTPDWVFERWAQDNIMFSENHVLVNTLEGPIKYPYGYVIIEGAFGEVYGIDPRVFEETYDIVK